MSLTLIAAVAKNGCIGKDGRLPWRIPEDLKRFKMLTTGHTVLMGRKTWESIPEKFRPLPDRTNIVLTKQTDYDLPVDVERFDSLEKALAAHQFEEDVFVIGGARIYEQTMGAADRLMITEVDQTIEGDAFFPKIDPEQWLETEREPHDGFAFVTYHRR